MVTRAEKAETDFEKGSAGRPGRAWRYGPILLWMAFIFFASTGEFSASNTSRIIRPLLLWLFPEMSEASLKFAHFLIRKLAHLLEYAVFGFLMARALVSSSHEILRRTWFLSSLLVIALYAFADEFHQFFVPSRTGTIYDSFIDITGGFISLSLFALWRRTAGKKEA